MIEGFPQFAKLLPRMKRRGSHGAGTWGLPGGHIEFGEAASQAVVREAYEETGISIHEHVHQHTFEEVGWSEAVFAEEGKHYVTILFKAALLIGVQAKIMEPGKCSELAWTDGHRTPDGGWFPPLSNYLLWHPWR